MAWDTELVSLLRSIIGDIDEDTYTDTRLKNVILSSAQLIDDIDFLYDYTANISTTTLTPDPTTGTRDDAFINLVVLKAACVLANAELKKHHLKGVAIKDGPSSIDGKGIIAALKDWAEKMCGNYEKAKLEYRLGSLNPGQAIIGPHRTEYSGYYDHRSRGTYGY